MHLADAGEAAAARALRTLPASDGVDPRRPLRQRRIGHDDITERVGILRPLAGPEAEQLADELGGVCGARWAEQAVEIGEPRRAQRPFHAGAGQRRLATGAEERVDLVAPAVTGAGTIERARRAGVDL
jgi:hypothetical protein